MRGWRLRSRSKSVSGLQAPQFWKARSRALGANMSLGSQYVVGLCAKSCTTGSILDQEQIQAARRENVLNSLSEIVRTLRTRLGESLATVEKHSRPLADATTSSLEALKAYSMGQKVNLSSGSA